MRNLSSILFIILLVSSSKDALAQVVPWQEDRPLISEDFKGPKRTTKKFATATTASRIKFNMERDPSGRSFPIVYTYFDCNKSWKKHRQIKPYTLKHEQLHFDIAELNARLLRKDFLAYMSRHPDDWKYERLKSIYSNAYYRMRRYQKKYDRQTKHSRNKSKQEEWNQYVAYRLREMVAYQQDSSFRLALWPGLSSQ